MYILGISCYYHDASAALLKDGVVVAAAEEERFTRKKHDTSFPLNAITYCLKSQRITMGQVDAVGFYEKPFLKFERLLGQHVQMFPKSLKTFVSAMPSWIHEKLHIRKSIKKLGYEGEVYFIEHHLAHAAASFLVSPFKKAAILTADGVGEWSTTTWGIGNEKEIQLLGEIRFPHSLGLLYSTITAYLGFTVNNAEYKVMGLASYGDMDKKTNSYYEKLKQVVDIKEDGSYTLDLKYFKYHYADRMPSQAMEKLLDGPTRKKETEVAQRHKDIAAALQLILEEAMTAMLKDLSKKTHYQNVVLGGGVALNSVYNGKILRNTPFKRVWIHPNPSDGGSSIGVALYIYHTILGKKREKQHQLSHAYLGPAFSTEEIQQFLDARGIRYSKFKNQQELIASTAKMIFDNKVVGWFQGKMEWGPRALGSRSILANPCNPQAKELLNEKVKHREHFRPFAPVVCADDALKYFDCDKPLPEITHFMLIVYPIKKEWNKKIRSVTHVDGSGRLQTISRKQNHLYYEVIKAFGKLSKIPILINTSFNIRGEPIVCTPADAYTCMMGTGIDCLVMGNFLIKRSDNEQDQWNSEHDAKD